MCKKSNGEFIHIHLVLVKFHWKYRLSDHTCIYMFRMRQVRKLRRFYDFKRFTEGEGLYISSEAKLGSKGEKEAKNRLESEAV